MADKTRRVFLGHKETDMYIHSGKRYGPGVVEVPASIASDLEEAVRRVEAKENSGVDPTAVGTPRPVVLEEATDDELMEMMRSRGLAPAEAAGDTAPADAGNTGLAEAAGLRPTSSPPVVPPPPNPVMPPSGSK